MDSSSRVGPIGPSAPSPAKSPAPSGTASFSSTFRRPRRRPMARSSAPRASANGSNETLATKALRCVIYTRKSTEEGLQKDFNSLDAQREAAEAFILSQKREGWQVVADHFDDGGYTGPTWTGPLSSGFWAPLRRARWTAW